ncbi:hypothetical protein MA16_Dca008303 [Dendrobium catenatum]|uniref:Uncharacterized protein n=1 Tax=Dendrobium catenatum TaxID=906689 RepID=A0A2I0W7Y7_9ASPA|nr:hypothetical protein MA16_Dca008303 [Dendrobium catenatum]
MVGIELGGCFDACHLVGVVGEQFFWPGGGQGQGHEVERGFLWTFVHMNQSLSQWLLGLGEKQLLEAV